MTVSSLPGTQFVDAVLSPSFLFYTSPLIREGASAETRSFPENGRLPVGGAQLQGTEVVLDGEGRVDLAAVLGRTSPVKTQGLLVGSLDASEEGTVLLGAGADWWWSCRVNGDLVFDRSLSFADGNRKGSFSKLDWIFPVRLRKGPNLVVFQIASGSGWRISTGVLSSYIRNQDASKPLPCRLEEVLSTWLHPIRSLVSSDVTDHGAIVSYEVESDHPVGLRYRARGSEEWKSFWRSSSSGRQVFRLGDLEADTDYEARPMRIAYRGDRFEVEACAESVTFRSAASPVSSDAEADPPYAIPAHEGLALFGTTSESPVSFRVGDPIDFYFTLRCADRAKVPASLFLTWEIHGDDGQRSFGFDPISLSCPVHLRCSLSRPGFVRVQARLTDCSCSFPSLPELSFDGGAGADVAEIRPASSAPADLDAYWRRQRERLSAVPLKAEVVPLADRRFPDGTEVPEGLDAFAVRVECAGPAPVTGYLTAPSAPGRYPARCHFDGYSTVPQRSHRGPLQGWVCFHVNAHGYELGREDGYYADYFKRFEKDGFGYGLSPAENADPDTAYFNGMALRVMRAFDYLKTRPDWNGKDLVAIGGSQGGLQAIWAASLVEGLTFCDTSITWCSNVAGASLDKRMAGWHPGYVRGLDYYDTCFHAARIPASCRVSVTRAGLGDYTCPPSGVTAMYNSISAPKSIGYYQNSEHMYVPDPPCYVRSERTGTVALA